MKRKVWNKRMWIYIVASVFALLVVYLIVQGIRCNNSVRKSIERLSKYSAKTANLSYGDMTYVDIGEGPAILSVHGIFGGYDQAYDTCEDFSDNCRIIAPSRFGYLGSAVLGDGTPKEQAKAYVELLDYLGVDKVYVLATSAGGSVAIRFALDYPERTNGLILYCSAMPYREKPNNYSEYAGPPKFMLSDYIMFLISPLFKPIMGMEASTIYSMLPVSDRKNGVVLDASITNPDMARKFDDYKIEDLKMPILILHAKDDKLASYEGVSKVVSRFPNCSFISFEDGGHLMIGHGNEIKNRVEFFIGIDAPK